MMYILWALVAVLIVLKLLFLVSISWWWIVLLALTPLGVILFGILLAFIAAVMSGR